MHESSFEHDPDEFRRFFPEDAQGHRKEAMRRVAIEFRLHDFKGLELDNLKRAKLGAVQGSDLMMYMGNLDDLEDDYHSIISARLNLKSQKKGDNESVDSVELLVGGETSDGWLQKLVPIHRRAVASLLAHKQWSAVQRGLRDDALESPVETNELLWKHCEKLHLFYERILKGKIRTES